jgi:hypothetical protein
MFIVGVDPGGTTGIAWRNAAGKVESRDVEVGMAWERVYDVVAALISVLKNEGLWGLEVGKVVILVEDWVETPRSAGGRVLTGDSRTALIVMGAIYAWGGSCVSRSQNAALAKSTFTDDRLKRLGLWDKRSPHQRDAIRHLLVGERRAKQR